jgi:hypothetical protein
VPEGEILTDPPVGAEGRNTNTDVLIDVVLVEYVEFTAVTTKR